MVKYPIGIQTFSEIRKDGYIYVDKTEYIHTLVTTGKYYFLSRPRRFGKSLLLSTIESIFKGERHLFKGLAIDSLEWDWESHEVLHIDLNVRYYKDETSLLSILDRHLKEWEKKYMIEPDSTVPEDRFIEVIKKAFEISGRRVVILIDEYDKPLLAAIRNSELQSFYRKQLQGFYSVLKSMDQYIGFAMITGVSRFSKMSIFSALNNLNDISLTQKYNAICGITEDELTYCFPEGMNGMAEEQNISVSQLHSELKSNYDGYHFSAKGKDIYNPFSLLNTFNSQEFGSYWLATGTTSTLLDVLDINSYSIQDLEGYRCSENVLNGADIFVTDPVPFFFQTGYLTIKGYDPEFKQYILGFPNREVSEGFNDVVLKMWLRNSEPTTLISDFVRDVREGEPENFMKKLQSFFAGIPYDHASGKCSVEERNGVSGYKEIHYQNIMYVIMKLMGFYAHTEYRTSNGRIDMVVETKDYIYLMEFKIDKSPEEAIRQINEKRYSLSFQNSGKTIFLIGANFDTSTRRLSGYIIESEE